MLFLDGYPSPTMPDPSPEAQIILREQLERRLMALFPCALCCLLADIYETHERHQRSQRPWY